MGQPSPPPVKVGLVSGDGLPVSGLLTVFRNAFDLGRRLGIVADLVPAELGYSWRPDKPGFYPHGGPAPTTPAWMTVAGCDIPERIGADRLAERLDSIRASVADPTTLDERGRRQLRRLIGSVARHYERHFTDWLVDNDIDWVVAVNMTLSDAVPVTAALHAAADRHFAARARGGIAFWDHDLFGTCAIHDPHTGARLYPREPNEWTPLPADDRLTRWLVVSQELRREAARYPTDAVPTLVRNLLPEIPPGPLEARHLEFLGQQGLDLERPILLNPVRVFHPKGVHLAIRLLASVNAHAGPNGPKPVLLVFGDLTEEPAYADDVVALADHLGAAGDVRFLDGVPLSTVKDADGSWRLDEIDLLRVAAASFGAVVFTPAVEDVETVGLGPALAAIAGLPCVTTDYAAFSDVYGPGFECVTLTVDSIEAGRSAAPVIDLLERVRRGDERTRRTLEGNRRIVRGRFPPTDWVNTWQDLARPHEAPA